MERSQQKQQYTNQLAKETDKYIKEFGSLPTTPSDQRQRKIQKDRLVAEFTASLTNFQKVQRQAAEREKEFVARVRASSRVSGGFPEESSKERNLVSWESQTQPQAQLQDEEITEDDLRLIQERESSIRQLEADIMDINEIFKDLGMMIHEQGDVIDSIEANVENAEVHVQQANQQLSRAADYQRKSRKTLCIIIFILVIGVVEAVLLVTKTQEEPVENCFEALAQAFWIDIKRMDDPECYFNSLPKELEVKRDRMVHLLESVGLKPIVPDGGYFIIADVSLLDVDLFDMKDSNETYDYKFVKWMIKNKKLSAIPVSAFCNAETKLQFEKFVRFCFIKKDSTLDAAEEIIKAWSRQNS
ncbi:hypothetical protein E5288_WYG003377 [Bos mutus]|uniref:Syntaxin-7 n=1 Tax=Bos mutus TaxID=72004 RepID=A0A6B0RF16_9CETA|nr:hypothetical protein [Bos mutus]